MKVFLATLDKRYNGNIAVVVANTESEALGLVLQQKDYEDTCSQRWEIKEIDTGKISVEEVHYPYE